MNNPIPEMEEMDCTDRVGLLIWWTSQAECEALVAATPEWDDYDAIDVGAEGTPPFMGEGNQRRSCSVSQLTLKNTLKCAMLQVC